MGTDQFQKRRGFVPAHTISTHPGVDFHMHRDAFARGTGHPRKFLSCIRFVQTNRQVMLHTPRQLSLLPFPQKEQRSGDPGIA